MNFLTDENLSPDAAAVMSIIGRDDGDTFGALLQVAPRMPPGEGFPDEKIPALCADHSFDALITVNHKDFGAKKALYEALIDRGVSVVVLRAGRLRMTLRQQVQLLTTCYARVRVLLSQADAPILVRVSASGVAEARSLEELAAEFERGDRKNLP